MNDQQLKQKYLELGWDTFTDEGFVEIAGPFFFKKDVNCMHFLFETSIKHQNRNQVLQGGARLRDQAHSRLRCLAIQRRRPRQSHPYSASRCHADRISGALPTVNARLA